MRECNVRNIYILFKESLKLIYFKAEVCINAQQKKILPKKLSPIIHQI